MPSFPGTLNHCNQVLFPVPPNLLRAVISNARFMPKYAGWYR
jgi:hypothetical protein